MKKGDILIILITILISIASILFLMLGNEETENKLVVLKIGGDTIKTIAIDGKTEGTYDFQFGNNIGYMEVKAGRVRLLKMDKQICPQQICSLTGWVEKSYETIVCLPNKITVEIEENESIDVDEISF